MRLFGLQITRAREPSEKPERRRGVSRSFRAGDQSDLLAGWQTDYGFTPAETASKLGTVRSRSRDLAKNNPYTKKLLWMMSTNVVGDKGFVLRAEAGSFAKGQFQPDHAANNELERRFREWGDSPPWCDAQSRRSLIDIQRLAVFHIVRDGEAIIRIHRGRRKRGNPFGLSLSMIPPDALDHRLNVDATGRQNMIRNGVEYDSESAPVAYHFLTRSGGLWAQDQYTSYADREHTRIPARDIIHLMFDESCTQDRGWPWLAAVLTTLHHLNEYDKNELVASRENAAHVRTWKRTSTEMMDEDQIAEPETVAGSVSDVESGSQIVAPEGWEPNDYMPQRPNSTYADFHKAALRQVASGAYADYNTLASDGESVTWSTLREFKLHYTDFCKVLQRILIQHLMSRVYREWLTSYLSFGQTQLPLSKLSKFLHHRFAGRRWQWVNPSQEANANRMSRDYGWKTDAGIADELGADYDENVNTIKSAEAKVRGTYLENHYKQEEPNEPPSQQS